MPSYYPVPRDRQIKFRCDEETDARIRAAAAESGQTLSGWLLAAANEKMDRMFRKLEAQRRKEGSQE